MKSITLANLDVFENGFEKIYPFWFLNFGVFVMLFLPGVLRNKSAHDYWQYHLRRTQDDHLRQNVDRKSDAQRANCSAAKRSN